MNITSVNNNIKRVRSINTIENISKYTKILLPNNENKINVYDYFLHERPFSNIKIILNQEIIWCDKALLSAASPIFREEFLKNTKDDSLKINNINLNDFLLMLEFIYPIFNPEINEENITNLIELSHRFQFDILKHACQFYVMKYLNTIRRVFNNCQNLEVEGDYFLNKNKRHKQHDMIEFHNRTCIDAFNIIVNLCRWFKIYYNDNNRIPIQAIISVLQQISIDYLEQVMITIDINDEIKAYIYKERAQYLEQIHHIKSIA